MRFDLGILAGDNTKKFLEELTSLVEKLEALEARLNGKKGKAAPAEDADESEDQDEDEIKLESKGKKKSKFDEEEESDEEDESEESEDEAEDEEDESEEDEDAIKPKKRGRPAKTKFDDENEEESDDEEEDEAPVKKKAAKSKKVTLGDVNDACRARVTEIIKERGVTGKDARAVVLKLLKKKFKVDSVEDLEAEQYPAAVKLFTA